MKIPLVGGFLILSFLCCTAATPLDFQTQQTGSISLSTSLWKHCIVSTASEVCTTELSSKQQPCDEFDRAITISRVTSIIGCIFLFISAALSCARITFFSLRQPKYRYILLLCCLIGLVSSSVASGFGFILFFKSLCNKPSYSGKDSTIGPSPPLFVVAASFVLFGIIAEVCVKEGVDLVSIVPTGARNSSNNNNDNEQDDQDVALLEGEGGGREVTINFTYHSTPPRRRSFIPGGNFDNSSSAAAASSSSSSATTAALSNNNSSNTTSISSSQTTTTTATSSSSSSSSNNNNNNIATNESEGTWVLL